MLSCCQLISGSSSIGGFVQLLIFHTMFLATYSTYKMFFAQKPVLHIIDDEISAYNLATKLPQTLVTIPR